MTENQRIQMLKNGIADAFNSALPDTIPEDVLLDIKTKNSVIAQSIAETINSFCKSFKVKVSLDKSDITGLLGFTSQRSGTHTHIPTKLTPTSNINAETTLRVLDIMTIIDNSNNDIDLEGTLV